MAHIQKVKSIEAKLKSRYFYKKECIHAPMFVIGSALTKPLFVTHVISFSLYDCVNLISACV